jgi:superfamily II DNA/RNA helicase
MQLLTQQRMICNGLAQIYFKAEWPRYQASEPTPENLEGMFAPKLAALRGLIEQVVIGQQRKAVIFSQWRSMLRLCEWAVRDLLEAAGMRAVFFTGAESPKLREQAVVALHDDPGVTVMFLSDAGGVGLNLQRAASCCINLELPWNPAVLEQRIGRIYRLGQTLPIDVYNLVTEEGIEARIASLLDQKKAVFSTLFDGTTDQVVFDGQSSFLEGVKKLVEPLPLPVDATVEDANEEPLPSLASTDGVVPAALIGEENDARDQDASTTQRAASPAAMEQRPRSQVADAPAQGQSSGSRGANQLSVIRLPDGGLRIDAPAALAEPLAALLESLARSLRQAAPPPAQDAATNGAADATPEHGQPTPAEASS